MNINSSGSSRYNSSTSANKGMSSLISGMDTDGMVEQMLSGTQSKIDAKYGERQQVLWKQETYRDVITKINSFRSKYLDTLGSTNLLSAGFFGSMTTKYSSSAVRVTASGAASGRSTISVEQLAEKSSYETQSAVSGKLNGAFDATALDRSVTLEVVLGSGATQAKHEININLNGAATKEDILNQVNSALSGNADVNGKVTAKYDANGQLLLESANISSGVSKIRVSAKSSDLGMKMLGVYAGSTGSPNSSNGYKFKSMVNTEVKSTIKFALDGVTKSFELEPGDLNASSLQSKLDTAFGADVVKVSDTSGKLTFEVMNADGTTPSSGRQLTVSGDAAALDALGMKSGASNKVSLGTKLKDLNLVTGLQGDRFKFEINGVSIEASSDETLSSLISKINRSKAGVTVSFIPLQDKFKIESNESGAGHTVSMKNVEGNLLSSLFGANAGSATSSKELTVKSIAADNNISALGNFKKGSFSLKINGSNISVSIPAKADGTDYSQQEMLDHINNALESRYGFADDGSGRSIELNADASGNVKLHVRNGAKVEFGVASTVDGDVATLLGFSSKNNVATASTTLSELGLDTIVGPGYSTLGDLTGSNGFKFDADTARVTYDGNATLGGPSASQAVRDTLSALFGTDSITNGTSAEQRGVEGKNSIVVIDGVRTERSSNNFTVNGLTYTLMDVTATFDSAGNVTAANEVDIDTTVDTEKIFEGLKSFVEDYNKLIGELNELVDESASYKDYPPLTAAQKKEMSEREIEQWEEKAKEGLLRRDSDITGFLTQMRSILYTKPEGSRFALYDLGIDTSSEYQDKGKLVIPDEKVLKSMIESNPSDLYELFAGTNGVARKLQKVVDDTAYTYSSNPGSLVKLAGVKNRGSEYDNKLYDKVKEIDNRIETLRNRYESEKARYWKQFNSMETLLSQMNSQMNWISNQFSAG